MIDTHCHLTYDPLFERLDDVLSHAAEAGVDRMITVGTSPPDARKAARLARDHANIFSTVGVHPHYAADWPDRAMIAAAFDELAALPSTVALGEMGLDRHYSDPPIDDQKRLFEWQLELSAPIDRPIVIHNREATDETLAMVRASGIDPARFVFHCFTGSRDELDRILEFGATVGFTGIATFKSAADIADGAATVPDDRILVETDSPYLTPEPHRKVRPNEPCYVPYVARFLAERRGVSEEAFIAQVDANAQRLFGLP